MHLCLQLDAGDAGVGFLCVGGPHMASVGRGRDDGKGRMRERERMIQRGGNPVNERDQSEGEKTGHANHCKEKRRGMMSYT